jgi:hypothetical protein
MANRYIPDGYDLTIPTPTIGKTPPPIPITHHGSQIPPYPPLIGYLAGDPYPKLM